MSLKDTILAADDLDAELLEVPEWGVTISLRTPTVAERSRLGKAAIASGDTPDIAFLYPALLISTCYDPSTGEPIFSEDDVAAIQLKNGAVVERVAQEALRIAGMGPEAVPLQEADSSETVNISSSSDSLND